MFEKILLAIDGSEPSIRACELVQRLALASRADVVVFHVVERFLGYAGTVEAETLDEAGDLVDDAVRTLKDAGVSARGETMHAVTNLTASEILAAANAFDADVVVLGSRGRSDMAGLLLGS